MWHIQKEAALLVGDGSIYMSYLLLPNGKEDHLFWEVFYEVLVF